MAPVRGLLAVCFQPAVAWQLMFEPNAIADPGCGTNCPAGISLEQCQNWGSDNGYAWIDYSPSRQWCYGSKTDSKHQPPLNPSNGQQYGKQVWFNGACSSVTPPLCQCITDVSGRWVNIQSNPGPSTLSVTVGVDRSYTTASTSTWSNSVTTQTQAGFKAFGIGTQVTVTGETSQTIGSSLSETFQETTTVQQEFDFPAGVVWQWQMIPDSPCGQASVLTSNFAVTDGLYDPPCCLPGYALNISTYQQCHAASDGTIVNLCSQTIV